METNQQPQDGGHNLDSQEFNGKTYRLYRGERYFSRGSKRLHRVVWEHHNGAIPAGSQIHHRDGNPHNNDISNLELLEYIAHVVADVERRDGVGSERVKRNLDQIRPLTKAWHASEEGRRKHSEQAKAAGFGKPDLAEKPCEQCSAAFKPATHHARFCSNKCKSAFRRARNADTEVRSCAQCGSEFTANKYSPTRTCSASCAGRLSRAAR